MKNDQQEKAKNLYFQTDFSNTEIADMLRIPRRTLHYWIRENNWDRQRECAGAMPSFIAENCYRILSRFTEQLLSEERADTPITYKEANTLHKLTLTIGKLRTRSTLNESMELFGHFMDSVQARSPQMAQAIMPFVDEFIAHSTVTADVFATQPLRPAEPMPDISDLEAIQAEMDRFKSEQAAAAQQSPAQDPPAEPVAELVSKEKMDADFKIIADKLNSVSPMPPELTERLRQFHHNNYHSLQQRKPGVVAA